MKYNLLLYDGPSLPPVSQELQADSDADALDVAQISLLAAPGYTHAEVFAGGVRLAKIKRDIYKASQ